MIHTKDDLKYYLSEDIKRMDRKPTLKDIIFQNEDYYIYKFINTLRELEYLTNNRNGFFNRLRYIYKYTKFKRLKHRTRINISPNTIGPGLRIYHLGMIMIAEHSKIGKNFTVRPGCVVGVTNDNPYNCAIIGDDVEFSLGCKVFGKVRIGDNVNVVANSVVLRNVPSNHIAIGIPAKNISKESI